MSSARKWTCGKYLFSLGKKKRKRYFTGTRRGGEVEGRLLFFTHSGQKVPGGGRRGKVKESAFSAFGRKAPEAACEGGFKFLYFEECQRATSAALFATGRLGRSMISPGPAGYQSSGIWSQSQPAARPLLQGVSCTAENQLKTKPLILVRAKNLAVPNPAPGPPHARHPALGLGHSPDPRYTPARSGWSR